jgi:membrane-bound lytic murein transglycosylase F
MIRVDLAFGLIVTAIALQVAESAPEGGKPSTPVTPSQWTKITRYDDIFKKYTRQYFGPGFDWKVFKAQAMAESNLSPNAKSWVGARGLMQLMPATYREVQTKNPELGAIDDPRWNIAAGIFYDKKLYDAWSEMNMTQSRLSYVLGSYNAGRGTLLNAKATVQKQGLDEKQWNNVEDHAHKVPRWRYEETLNYVRRIRAFYEALSMRNGFDGFLPPPSEPAPAAAP